MTGPRSWVFLSEAGHLDELGWDGPQREKLWRYNQHYFDDLNALDAANRLPWHEALVSDWVAHLFQPLPSKAWLCRCAGSPVGWNTTCWATTCLPTPRR